LGLPKLLSHTDLCENFVMWSTVQELLLGIVVCVICKQQVVLHLTETANSVACEEHWNSLKLVYIVLHESVVSITGVVKVCCYPLKHWSKKYKFELKYM